MNDDGRSPLSRAIQREWRQYAYAAIDPQLTHFLAQRWKRFEFILCSASSPTEFVDHGKALFAQWDKEDSATPLSREHFQHMIENRRSAEFLWLAVADALANNQDSNASLQRMRETYQRKMKPTLMRRYEHEWSS